MGEKIVVDVIREARKNDAEADHEQEGFRCERPDHTEGQERKRERGAEDREQEEVLCRACSHLFRAFMPFTHNGECRKRSNSEEREEYAFQWPWSEEDKQSDSCDEERPCCPQDEPSLSIHNAREQ